MCVFKYEICIFYLNFLVQTQALQSQ